MSGSLRAASATSTSRTAASAAGESTAITTTATRRGSCREPGSESRRPRPVESAALSDHAATIVKVRNNERAFHIQSILQFCRQGTDSAMVRVREVPDRHSLYTQPFSTNLGPPSAVGPS